jgi:MazG family protein
MSTAGARLDDLVRIMRALRAPDGCPWDREQTLASLRPFLLEETYEALDAIDRDDQDDLREEIGDLMFELVFLAQIAEERGEFTVADAIADACDKLIRRHPHVFGDAAKASTADEVAGRWEALKQDEGGARQKTTLGGVPRTLPALLRAYEYGSRAAAIGFDWTRATDVLAKIEEEVHEVRCAVEAHDESGAAAIEDEMGDLLFAIANLSRKLGVEPESALRRANNKFFTRFTALEQAVAASNRRMQECTLEELEAEWQRLKGKPSTD